jgi:hypothetical protein
VKPLLPVLALVLAATLGAETPVPTPTPDWHVYDDPAMHFRAPDGFFPIIAPKQVTVDKLTDDPVMVDAWIYPVRDHVRRIALEQEYFTGDAKAFEAQYKGQLRDQFTAPFFKNEEEIRLKNGMPAIYFEMTSGEGFDVQKFYYVVWADGQRGIAVALQASLDDLSTAVAKTLLADATAVRYPIGRE